MECRSVKKCRTNSPLRRTSRQRHQIASTNILSEQQQQRQFGIKCKKPSRDHHRSDQEEKRRRMSPSESRQQKVNRSRLHSVRHELKRSDSVSACGASTSIGDITASAVNDDKDSAASMGAGVKSHRTVPRKTCSAGSGDVQKSNVGRCKDFSVRPSDFDVTVKVTRLEDVLKSSKFVSSKKSVPVTDTKKSMVASRTKDKTKLQFSNSLPGETDSQREFQHVNSCKVSSKKGLTKRTKYKSASSASSSVATCGPVGPCSKAQQQTVGDAKVISDCQSGKENVADVTRLADKLNHRSSSKNPFVICSVVLQRYDCDRSTGPCSVATATRQDTIVNSSKVVIDNSCYEECTGTPEIQQKELDHHATTTTANTSTEHVVQFNGYELDSDVTSHSSPVRCDTVDSNCNRRAPNRHDDVRCESTVAECHQAADIYEQIEDMLNVLHERGNSDVSNSFSNSNLRETLSAFNDHVTEKPSSLIRKSPTAGADERVGDSALIVDQESLANTVQRESCSNFVDKLSRSVLSVSRTSSAEFAITGFLERGCSLDNTRTSACDAVDETVSTEWTIANAASTHESVSLYVNRNIGMEAFINADSNDGDGDSDSAINTGSHVTGDSFSDFSAVSPAFLVEPEYLDRLHCSAVVTSLSGSLPNASYNRGLDLACKPMSCDVVTYLSSASCVPGLNLARNPMCRDDGVAHGSEVNVSRLCCEVISADNGTNVVDSGMMKGNSPTRSDECERAALTDSQENMFSNFKRGKRFNRIHPRRKFICLFCLRSAYTQQQLNWHIRLQHLSGADKLEKSFACGKKGKSVRFRAKRVLQKLQDDVVGMKRPTDRQSNNGDYVGVSGTSQLNQLRHDSSCSLDPVDDDEAMRDVASGLSGDARPDIAGGDLGSWCEVNPNQTTEDPCASAPSIVSTSMSCGNVLQAASVSQHGMTPRDDKRDLMNGISVIESKSFVITIIPYNRCTSVQSSDAAAEDKSKIIKCTKQSSSSHEFSMYSSRSVSYDRSRQTNVVPQSDVNDDCRPNNAVVAAATSRTNSSVQCDIGFAVAAAQNVISADRLDLAPVVPRSDAAPSLALGDDAENVAAAAAAAADMSCSAQVQPEANEFHREAYSSSSTFSIASYSSTSACHADPMDSASVVPSNAAPSRAMGNDECNLATGMSYAADAQLLSFQPVAYTSAVPTILTSAGTCDSSVEGLASSNVFLPVVAGDSTVVFQPGAVAGDSTTKNDVRHCIDASPGCNDGANEVCGEKSLASCGPTVEVSTEIAVAKAADRRRRNCTVCNKCISLSHIAAHERLHYTRQYHCDLCKRSFAKQYQLERHIVRSCKQRAKATDCPINASDDRRSVQTPENTTFFTAQAVIHNFGVSATTSSEINSLIAEVISSELDIETTAEAPFSTCVSINESATDALSVHVSVDPTKINACVPQQSASGCDDSQRDACAGGVEMTSDDSLSMRRRLDAGDGESSKTDVRQQRVYKIPRRKCRICCKLLCISKLAKHEKAHMTRQFHCALCKKSFLKQSHLERHVARKNSCKSHCEEDAFMPVPSIRYDSVAVCVPKKLHANEIALSANQSHRNASVSRLDGTLVGADVADRRSTGGADYHILSVVAGLPKGVVQIDTACAPVEQRRRGLNFATEVAPNGTFQSAPVDEAGCSFDSIRHLDHKSSDSVCETTARPPAKKPKLKERRNCRFCHKFLCARQIAAHELMHSSREFHCAVCKKSFLKKSQLERHVETTRECSRKQSSSSSDHNNNLAFEFNGQHYCGYCSKRFSEKQLLVNHLTECHRLNNVSSIVGIERQQQSISLVSDVQQHGNRGGSCQQVDPLVTAGSDPVLTGINPVVHAGVEAAQPLNSNNSLQDFNSNDNSSTAYSGTTECASLAYQHVEQVPDCSQLAAVDDSVNSLPTTNSSTNDQKQPPPMHDVDLLDISDLLLDLGGSSDELLKELLNIGCDFNPELVCDIEDDVTKLSSSNVDVNASLLNSTNDDSATVRTFSCPDAEYDSMSVTRPTFTSVNQFSKMKPTDRAADTRLNGSASSLDEESWHQNGSVSKCRFCGKIFSTRDWLARHEVLHRCGEKFICLDCSQQFSSICYLQIHATVHLFEKSARFNICRKCGQKFRLTLSLLHKNVWKNCLPNVDNAVTYYCTNCISNCTMLPLTATTTNTYLCERCGKFIVSTELFEQHIREHALRFDCILTEMAVETMENGIKIPSGTASITLENLQCLRVQLWKYTIHQSNDVKRRPYICALCVKQFDSRWMLQQHLFGRHSRHLSTANNSVTATELFDDSRDGERALVESFGSQQHQIAFQREMSQMSENLHSLLHDISLVPSEMQDQCSFSNFQDSSLSLGHGETRTSGVLTSSSCGSACVAGNWTSIGTGDVLQEGLRQTRTEVATAEDADTFDIEALKSNLLSSQPLYTARGHL